MNKGRCVGMAAADAGARVPRLHSFLEGFTLPGPISGGSRRTSVSSLQADGLEVPVFTNEFWTARQRQAASIHEISYRACYKPQLPRFFIEWLTAPDNVVYDPFGGRGTTAIEAGLLGRRALSNDINPLSPILARPRLLVPSAADIADRLQSIPMRRGLRAEFDLSMFYHPDTETEILSLRNYLERRRTEGTEDEVDAWIRMTATNRLTGHSPGFFSVYTLPPNQAVMPERQLRINHKRGQKPEYRDTRALILRKTQALQARLSQADIESLRRCGRSAIFLCEDAALTPAIPDGRIALTVTSPPFLDVVQYAADNWLRSWFNGLDAEAVGGRITMARNLADWSAFVGRVFRELYRITMPGGWVAFEVGEIRGGQVKLEDHVIPDGMAAGWHCRAVIVNEQSFTKTARIWGIANNAAGTNSNRIVLFSK